MKNHYVPEFYFKPWLNSNRQLLRFGWQGKRLDVQHRTPGQICYAHDLHTLTGPLDDEKRQMVEHWLTKGVDTQAAPVVAAILTHGMKALNDETASHMARFILSLIVRRPESVEFMRQTAPAELRRNMVIQDGLMDKSELTEFASLENYAETISPGFIENSGRTLITDLVADQRSGERLCQLHWWLSDFGGTSLAPIPTTDRAVTTIGNGLDDPNAGFILPLSPALVLYLTAPGARRQMLPANSGQLALVTVRAILSNSRMFAFGTAQTNRNLIERFLPKPVQGGGRSPSRLHV